MTMIGVYEKLAAHLDQGVVGSPVSPVLLELLEILFPGREAEIGARLPMTNQTLAQLTALFPDQPDLEAILLNMAQRGTVFIGRRPGVEPVYRLLQSIGGWVEVPFYAGHDTPELRRLAPLILKYREETLSGELARGNMPVMRVLPVSRTLRESVAVLPFEAVRPLVEAQSFCAVAHCGCRRLKTLADKGCHHATETCLHFGSMGRYLVDSGKARLIQTAEALSILEAAHLSGLSHSMENMDGYLATICNCCSCCCVFLSNQVKKKLNVLSPSRYLARVDQEVCAGCGTCQNRCPSGAIRVESAGRAQVDPRLCLGCGVCTPTCETGAVDLVLRDPVKPPPSPEEFLRARYKAAIHNHQ
jgi:ferredoxin